MRSRWLTFAVVMSALLRPLADQDLAPRAYIITPINSNAVTLTYSFYDGGLNFNGAVPLLVQAEPTVFQCSVSTIHLTSSAIRRT